MGIKLITIELPHDRIAYGDMLRMTYSTNKLIQADIKTGSSPQEIAAILRELSIATQNLCPQSINKYKFVAHNKLLNQRVIEDAYYFENAKIQYQPHCRANWLDASSPVFDWKTCNYRIKLEQTIDWSKIPVDTKVMVGTSKATRDFATYIPELIRPYGVFDANSLNTETRNISLWSSCKIHPDVKIKDEWLTSE